MATHCANRRCRAGIRETCQSHFDNIPGVWDVVQNTVVDGDQAAVEFIASWDQPTDENPRARGQLRIAAFITVRDDKIVRDVSYFDRQEFSQNYQVATENQVPISADQFVQCEFHCQRQSTSVATLLVE